MKPNPDSNGSGSGAPLLLDAKALAEKLSISKATVWRMRDGGKLPQPVRLGSCVRWRFTDVERWLADGCPALASARPRK